MIKIHCHRCNLFLGEIRDAKLRRDIAYLCAQCAGRDDRPHGRSATYADAPDWIREIFGDKL